jgi:DNA-directed RNA polymerase sigma subunit (sigma70/sigma32)
MMNERTKHMVAMRKERKTYQEIGNHFRLSRERIRQIFAKLEETRQAKNLTNFRVPRPKILTRDMAAYMKNYRRKQLDK